MGEPDAELPDDDHDDGNGERHAITIECVPEPAMACRRRRDRMLADGRHDRRIPI
jgi:hypothetical protein